jgi:tRNA pseudouridine55 synthase
LFGEATKLSAYLTTEAKTYRARIAFGASTDTLDRQGRVTESRDVEPDELAPERVDRALAVERARQSQVPPAVSAIKVDGERAYRRARRGEEVGLGPRPVSVERISLLELDAALRLATVELRVSKGYYVRSLARDVGATLGVPAHLDALVRLASGGFALETAAPWPPAVPMALMPIADAARRCLPAATLTFAGRARARSGLLLGVDDFAEAPGSAVVHAWFDGGGRLVALGARSDGSDDLPVDDQPHFRVVRGFSDDVQ